MEIDREGDPSTGVSVPAVSQNEPHPGITAWDPLEHLGLLVSLEPVPDELPGVEEWLDDWIQVAPGAVLVHFSDSLRLLVRDGRRVSLQLDESEERGSDPSWILSGWAARLAALQGGAMSLHAAVVDVGGTFVGIAGNSGAGKSTTAMGLRALGHQIHTDDVAILNLRNGGVWATAIGSRVSLMPDAVRELGVDERELVRLAGGRDKSSLRVEGAPGNAVRLDVVVVLAREGQDDVDGSSEAVHDGAEGESVRQARAAPDDHIGGGREMSWCEATGAERLRELIAHTYIGGLAPRVLGQREYFDQLAQFADAVPVVVLERPAHKWSLADVVECIVEVADSVRRGELAGGG